MPRDVSPAELEIIARTHVVYECRTLVSQVVALAHLDAPSYPEAIRLALIEAPLVHLRLLDDFLRTPKAVARKDDITAQHYSDQWRPGGFLSEDDRSDINAQLQHLAGRRVDGRDWDLLGLLGQCADRFTDFMDALYDHEREREPWFERSILSPWTR